MINRPPPPPPGALAHYPVVPRCFQLRGTPAPLIMTRQLMAGRERASAGRPGTCHQSIFQQKGACPPAAIPQCAFVPSNFIGTVKCTKEAQHKTQNGTEHRAAIPSLSTKQRVAGALRNSAGHTNTGNRGLGGAAAPVPLPIVNGRDQEAVQRVERVPKHPLPLLIKGQLLLLPGPQCVAGTLLAGGHPLRRASQRAALPKTPS